MNVSAGVGQDGLVIQVRDHGPGIAPADLPHLFERFYRGARGEVANVGHGNGPVDRSRPAGRAEWAGLGRELRGRRSAIHPRRPRSCTGIDIADFADMTTPHSRILLVDDEVSIQRAVGPLLRSRGYEVDIAGTGAQALEMFAERKPALIVLDLGLPDIEGTEVCRRIRATSQVPIIVLSARGAEADKVNALDLGADDYVTKPFGPEELLARIRVALRRTGTESAVETGLFRAGTLTIDYDRRRVVRDEHRDPSDAEGVRSSVAARAESRSRADASGDSEGTCGARTPWSSQSTCGRWSRSFGRRSSRTPRIRSTWSASHGSDIGS